MNLPPSLAAKCLALEAASPSKVKLHSQERVTLDLPPSTNHLFRNAKSQKGTAIRVKTSEYTAWMAHAVPRLCGLKPPVSYPCVFMMLISGKANRQRDGTNMVKPLEDACVTAGVIPDDSLKWVHSGYWVYEPSAAEPSVTVWFEPMGGYEDELSLLHAEIRRLNGVIEGLSERKAKRERVIR